MTPFADLEFRAIYQIFVIAGMGAVAAKAAAAFADHQMTAQGSGTFSDIGMTFQTDFRTDLCPGFGVALTAALLERGMQDITEQSFSVTAVWMVARETVGYLFRETGAPFMKPGLLVTAGADLLRRLPQQPVIIRTMRIMTGNAFTLFIGAVQKRILT